MAGFINYNNIEKCVKRMERVTKTRTISNYEENSIFPNLLINTQLNSTTWYCYAVISDEFFNRPGWEPNLTKGHHRCYVIRSEDDK